MKTFILLSTFLLSLLVVQAQRNQEERPLFSWAGEAKGNGIPSVFMISASAQSGWLKTNGGGRAAQAAIGWRTHFVIGVPLNQTFFMHPEIAFSHLRTGDGQNGTSLTSMDVPLQLALHTGKKRNWFFKAGPELSLTLNANQRSGGKDSSVYQGIQQTQWFLTAAIEHLHGRFGFSARYRHGMTRISAAAGGPISGTYRSLSAGIIYWLVKKESK